MLKYLGKVRESHEYVSQAMALDPTGLGAAGRNVCIKIQALTKARRIKEHDNWQRRMQQEP